MARSALAKLAVASVDIGRSGDGIVVGENGLPVAIRLFRAGENETTKGVFLFDEEAAKLVMSDALEHGVDYMIDLEHMSLDDDARNWDPDSRGWFKLQVKNGELWAVDIRWSPDGERRLREKTQRYISPAFAIDDDGRITRIANIALVAMPATHGTPALVAAATRSTRMTPTPKMKEAFNLLTARHKILSDKLAKLADGEGGGGKGSAVKSAAEKASQALADLAAALDAGDIDAIFAASTVAKEAMDACENAIADMTGGAPDADAEAPAEAMADKPADDDKKEEQKMSVAELAELMTLRAEKSRRETEEAARKLAAETEERRVICASMVRDRGMRPADVWADDGRTPKSLFAKMPIGELRELAKTLGSRITDSGPRPPNGGGMSVEVNEQVLSETEVAYVKARHGQMSMEGKQLRSLDQTLVRYQQAKVRQLRDAEEKGDDVRAKQLATTLSSKVVKLSRDAGLVTLASTPVQPIEEFGASSQIALQSFRLEYNIALASMPAAWAETIGQMLSDGSMKVTFPISYDATEYTEKTNQNAAANQPLSFDLEVKQREFYAAKQIELRRLVKGDFAYVQRWAQSAAEMARARVFLRNYLVTTLLEAGSTTVWGVTTNQPSGIDGANFFSASHKINPADANRKLRGVATFSNYQSSATPLNAANLTSEKNYALQVAAPDGRELGIVYDGILYPSALEQTAYNLLKVQDLILDAKATLNTVNNAFGQVRNPHFNSGLEMTRAMDLAGTDNTANYYLYSREGIGRGLPPWVICEDPTEEIRLWDETSDFYKSKGEIKIESHVFLNAALAFPHCIRLVKGS